MSTETKDRDDDDAKSDKREVREHVDETTTDKVTVERSEPAAPEKPHGDT